MLGSIVRIAGSLFIDGGRPVPGRFQETLENLRELQPSSFATVPAAFPLLLDALEGDSDLRAKLLQEHAERGLWRRPAATGELRPPAEHCHTAARVTRLPFDCGWGMTETTSTGLMVYWNVDRTGVLGLPQPGLLAKLVPIAEEPSSAAFELRVKGPNVTPGYYRDAERRPPKPSTTRLLPHRRHGAAGSMRASPRPASPLPVVFPRNSSSPPAPGCRRRPCAAS